ncbi:hypothetical protein T10_154 [Trichinella papuae]|uniref:Uncharacterized protein n=1 Tax=Trichinella papuae TaxID=268474 RepID=A0A0V1MEZ7_9BILA|nr:hypothetical protein T10_154 [Trichinella papuae]
MFTKHLLTFRPVGVTAVGNERTLKNSATIWKKTFIRKTTTTSKGSTIRDAPCIQGQAAVRF